jgi:hypothetical protein
LADQTDVSADPIDLPLSTAAGMSLAHLHHIADVQFLRDFHGFITAVTLLHHSVPVAVGRGKRAECR